jgi:hypothetical protein
VISTWLRPENEQNKEQCTEVQFNYVDTVYTMSTWTK